MKRPTLAVIASLLVTVVLGATAVSPVAAAIQLETVATGLTSPLYVTSARDSTARVLSGGERGLLGLTFHPRYAVNGRFFVNYTRQTDGATVVAEYRVSDSVSNVAGSTETVLLTIAQPFAHHNGGMIAV